MDIIDFIDNFEKAFDSANAKYERLTKLSTDEMKREFPRLTAKAEKHAANSIGCDFRIRTDKKTVVGGKIVEAAIGRFEVRAGNTFKLSVRVIFRVVMESGASKKRREFHVAALPN